jgi:hypothetical protein
MGSARPIGLGSEDYRAVAATVREVDQGTWLAALPAGTVAPDDRATAVEATSAMTSSRQWPPLVETASGTMKEFVWDVADAMAAGVPLEQFPSLPQGTGYQRHLGCPE